MKKQIYLRSKENEAFKQFVNEIEAGEVIKFIELIEDQIVSVSDDGKRVFIDIRKEE